MPNGSWRVSNHHPSGSNWHPLERAGILLPKRMSGWWDSNPWCREFLEVGEVLDPKFGDIPRVFELPAQRPLVKTPVFRFRCCFCCWVVNSYWHHFFCWLLMAMNWIVLFFFQNHFQAPPIHTTIYLATIKRPWIHISGREVFVVSP